MKVFLTGFSGNLGNVVSKRLLQDGHTVRALLHSSVLDPRQLDPKIEVIWGSLSQPHIFNRVTTGVDAVVHCAWDGRSSKVNRDGTIRLLEAAEQNGVGTFVHISSVAVYGLSRSLWGKVLDENHPFVNKEDSMHAYPWTKVIIEKELQRLCGGLRMNLIIIRPGLIISDTTPPVKKLITVKKRKYGLLVGRAKNHLPYIHVDDVAAMIALVLNKPVKYAAYNAVPTTLLSARKFLKQWGQQFDSDITVIAIPPTVLRMMNWGVQQLKRILGRQSSGNIDYQIMTGICNIRYSAKKAAEELGWEDSKTKATAQGMKL